MSHSHNSAHNSVPEHEVPLGDHFKELRMGERLVTHWAELCDGRPYPAEDDLDPEDLGELWDDCFLVQLRDIYNVIDYNYTYLGKNILNAYQSTLLPEALPDLVNLHANHIAHLLNEAIETLHPIRVAHELHISPNTEIRFRQVLVPLGSNKGEVVAILGHMSYCVFVDNARI